MVGILLRNQYLNRKLTLDNKLAHRKVDTDSHAEQVKQYAETCSELREEVRKLTDRVHECEESCARETKALNEELLGLRRQHVQEQISLINSIIQSVDSPLLKSLLKNMETVRNSLTEIQEIGTEVADSKDKS